MKNMINTIFFLFIKFPKFRASKKNGPTFCHVDPHVTTYPGLTSPKARRDMADSLSSIYVSETFVTLSSHTIPYHIVSFIFFHEILADSLSMETSTLTGLLKHVAGNFPSRRVISVSGKFDLTHSRLHHLVERAVSSLFAAGVRPGDVVALTFPNTVEVRLPFPNNTCSSIMYVRCSMKFYYCWIMRVF